MQSKFTKKERLEIGRRIYKGELNQEEAAVQYDINPYTARDYLRLYKAPLSQQKKAMETARHSVNSGISSDMSKQEGGGGNVDAFNDGF